MIVLLLPCTETEHDFSNLLSFVDLVDKLIVLDSGITDRNIIDILKVGIPTTFYDYYFDGDYSKMRNTLLSIVEPEGCNLAPKVIMIDDSYSIEGLTRDDILNHDIVKCKFRFIYEGNLCDSPYDAIKIFRSDCGFYTRSHNEILNYREGTILCKGTIIDNYLEMRNKDIVPTSRLKQACYFEDSRREKLLEDIISGVELEPHDQNDIDKNIAVLLNGRKRQ